MGVKTPDAYRIGAGQVTREYPADAVPARLRKQPSLPTMSRSPESSPVEQVVTAEVAVVRRKASVPPRQSTDSHTSKDAATPTQRNDVAPSAAPAQAQHRAEPSAPAREFAHLDEAGVSFEADQHPGVPVHRDWHRTTMRVVNPTGESAAEQRAESVPTVPLPTKIEEASRVGGRLACPGEASTFACWRIAHGPSWASRSSRPSSSWPSSSRPRHVPPRLHLGAPHLGAPHCGGCGRWPVCRALDGFVGLCECCRFLSCRGLAYPLGR